MITVIVVVCSAVAVWIVVDHLLAWRDERLQRGQGAWSSQFGHERTFEDTLPRGATEPAAASKSRLAR